MESAQRALPLIHEKWTSYPLATYPTLMEGLAGHELMGLRRGQSGPERCAEREFIDGIRSNGLSDRTVVTSNDLDRLAEIEKLAPDLPRMLFVGEKVPVSRLADEKLWAVAVNHEVATKDYVTELKKAGLIVVVWTVNEEQAWAKAKSAGADKVLTDKPSAYAAWLDKQWAAGRGFHRNGRLVSPCGRAPSSLEAASFCEAPLLRAFSSRATAACMFSAPSNHCRCSSDS